jgi:hypothetical protein
MKTSDTLIFMGLASVGLGAYFLWRSRQGAAPMVAPNSASGSLAWQNGQCVYVVATNKNGAITKTTTSYADSYCTDRGLTKP